MIVDELVRRAFHDLPTARLATLDPSGAPYVAALWLFELHRFSIL